MGGNLERNRWMIVDDADIKARIAERFAEVGRPYLAANSAIRLDDRSQKVIESAEFLVDHLAEVPALVIALRLDRPPLDPSHTGRRGGVLRLGAAGGVELPARGTRPRASVRRGPRSTSSTKRRSPDCSPSPSRSPRCASSPSATTPATRSPLHPAARPPRSPTSTAGSNPSPDPFTRRSSARPTGSFRPRPQTNPGSFRPRPRTNRTEPLAWRYWRSRRP